MKLKNASATQYLSLNVQDRFSTGNRIATRATRQGASRLLLHPAEGVENDRPLTIFRCNDLFRQILNYSCPDVTVFMMHDVHARGANTSDGSQKPMTQSCHHLVRPSHWGSPELDNNSNTTIMALSSVQMNLQFLVVSSLLSVAWSFSATTTGEWKPQIASLEERRRLRGMKHESENIGSLGFHHVEFYCGDAKSTAHRFSLALGMPCVGETGQSTGNDQCTSYGLVSGDFRLLMTAPYSQAMASQGGAPSPDDAAPSPLPSFSSEQAHAFFQKHGLAARAIGLEVEDAQDAFEKSVSKGATPVLEPTFVPTCQAQTEKGSSLDGCYIAEVQLYDDVVLRYVSYPDGVEKEANMPFLPHLAPCESSMSKRPTYGIRRIDHAVGNVPNLLEAHNRVKGFTGFHEFAEFTAEDVGTVDSGLNSVVLASDSEQVLLPLNEPTSGK